MTCCAKFKTCVAYSSIFCALGCLAASFLMTEVAIEADQWVTTDRESWGLWKHCVTTENDTRREERTCDSSHTAPGYYVAARAMVYISLFLEFLACSSCVFCVRVGIWVTLLYLSSALTPPVLLLTFYQDDDRWKDSDPSLGVGFWLFSVGQALALPCVPLVLYWYCGKERRAQCGQEFACLRWSSSCVQECWPSCIGSVSGCWDRTRDGCTESVTACCNLCEDSVNACCTRCIGTVVTCCTGCSKGISSCFQRLGGKESQWNTNQYPGTEQRIWHTENGTKPEWPRTDVDGQWNINPETTRKFVQTANSTNPERRQRNFEHQWNPNQNPETEQRLWYTGSGTKPEWYSRNVERQRNRNQNPEKEQRLWHTGSGTKPEWYSRDVELQWKRDRYSKPEQRVLHPESCTKLECGRPSLSDLPDHRVGWTLPDGVSESFV